jgi:hypothetical protein
MNGENLQVRNRLNIAHRAYVLYWAKTAHTYDNKGNREISKGNRETCIRSVNDT